MAKYCVLFNPKSRNKTGGQQTKKLGQVLAGNELDFTDVTALPDLRQFLVNLDPGTRLVLSGGDGTLNRFVNDAGELAASRPLLYWPAGTGNDFLRDIGRLGTTEPVEISRYLRNLPAVTVKGMTRKFLNGIGYGIDGYCCEIGDRQVARSDKPVNYTSIAIKGMLYGYTPTAAVVTVDGVRKEFDKAWLCPTMNGRFIGGGMMLTPDQDRLADNPKLVSCLVWHGTGRLFTLMAFPTVFKGEHLKYTKNIEIMRGRNVSVSFDRPTALQIDGETVLDVTEYSVTAN
ncbi:MAG: hypothetical protein IJR93_08390 [Treponema sp.]|nr:hypothetical protein [Treponema sp.]